ncbi:alpha/beta hydrolase [Microbacterium sp. R86528]|uniref:alpha/beta hydrolase n=1 Tax=Microbacterium sp. R86528 TaxID=3093864 RepID=UPI0037C8A81A
MPEFIDAHGIAIVYDVYPAATEPRAVVQLLHGVGEHAGRYHGVINDLVANGYTVYVNDHRGHGRTGMKQHGGDASKLGRLGVGGLPATLASVWQFTQLIRDENPSLPLVILGHSWGSFMAQMLINQHPEAYDALVLSGSALRTPTALNGGDLNARWKARDALGTEWLSADLRVGQDFIDDPLTTSTPLLKLFGVVDAARLYGRPRKDLGYDIPALLMVGREDSVGGPKSVHKLAAEYRERSGLTDVTTLVYPDARHEIFNDFAKGDVNADLIAWLNKRFVSRD